MIIQSSNLNMNSARTYSSNHTKSESLATWGGTGSAFYSSMYRTLNDRQYESTSDKSQVKDEEKSSEKNGSGENGLLDGIFTRRAYQVRQLHNQSNLITIRSQVLDYLFRIILGEGSDAYKNLQERMNQNNITVQEFGGSYDFFESYQEQEYTSFQTTGTVQTADGRRIDFDINLNMSRSFMSQYEERVDFGAAFACVDPLVINTGSSIANVSTQTFYFDLDCDGTLDEISTLGSGSGFLALDKNGDGIINDGSELFGTKSGDGFKDLMEYDLDHNGWIDEADEIFSQLRIWYADGSDTPKLVTLKEAGIGAISLQNGRTQFSLNNEDNSTNAYIRNTGIFLYENGGVGTIQHVDMVLKGTQ